MDEEVVREWTDDERLAIRRVAYECDATCYERLVALMGATGYGLREPVWSDYENLQISVPGA